MSNLDQVAKALGFDERNTPSDYHVYGTVTELNSDGSAQVSLNASTVDTRCALGCNVNVDDRVLVVIKSDGKAVVIGNITNHGGLLVGEIKQYAGLNTPNGWLICDGSAISRTTYAELFATIGTTYGTGDGSTTFNLPDLRGKVAIGTSADYDLGDTGGEAEKKLSANIGAVNTDAGSLGYIAESPTSYQGSHSATYAPSSNRTTFSRWAHSTPVTETDKNSRNVSIMQPYLAINYIIYSGVI